MVFQYRGHQEACLRLNWVLSYSFMKYALTLLFPGANLGISPSLKKKKKKKKQLNHRLLGVKSYMDVVFLFSQRSIYKSLT